MKINIGFILKVWTIEIEPRYGKDVIKYQDMINDWCTIHEDMLNKPIFDGKLAVYILNTINPKINSRVVAENLIPGTEDKSLPYMYF